MAFVVVEPTPMGIKLERGRRRSDEERRSVGSTMAEVESVLRSDSCWEEV